MVCGQLLINWNRRVPFQAETCMQSSRTKQTIFVDVCISLLKQIGFNENIVNSFTNQLFQLKNYNFKPVHKIKMGNGGILCDAISTPDVFVKIGTAEQQMQMFLQKYPQAKDLRDKIGEFERKLIIDKNQTRKYAQGIYIGTVNSKSVPHTNSGQKGFFLYNAGFFYEGQFKQGKREGKGRIISSQQCQYYEGEWKQNNPNGKGIYQATQSKRKYEGFWKDARQHGNGLQIYEDGSFYEGDFYNGQKSGKGLLQYPDKTLYKGDFMNNVIEGHGISQGRFHNYEGGWINGKMHGNGISTWMDDKGDIIGVYVGQYEKGLKHGYGQYKWGQKKVYKGKWNQGDMNSEGVLLNYEA